MQLISYKMIGVNRGIFVKILLLLGALCLFTGPAQAQQIAAPTGLHAEINNGTATLEWNKPTGLSNRRSRYTIEYHEVGKAVTKINTGLRFSSRPSYEITGFDNDKTYRFRVRVRRINPVDDAGAWSEWFTFPTVTVPTVHLTASPDPVTEGSSVTVTATLSATLASQVTIPLMITDNTAEPTDHGMLASITINANSLTGTGTITTAQDTDTDDETFTVALGALPSEVTAGTPSSVQIRIWDDDSTPRPDPTPDPIPDPPPEPKPKKVFVRILSRCGLGWAPQPQYAHPPESPKVMIYALEFEYNPARNAGYTCKTIEIRTGDDSIENLAGWKLYLGGLYNPAHVPMEIPAEHAQVSDRTLRLTPEMLGLETFRCNTVSLLSQPLPGVHYVLKTDKDIMVDTAYSCFIFGQSAVIEEDHIWKKSPRQVSSKALRNMDTPRIERYITKSNSVYVTYIDIEDFGWDRPVLSDWLLPEVNRLPRVAPLGNPNDTAGSDDSLAGRITFSEVMYATRSGGLPSPWIELYNPSAEIVDLEGWQLRIESRDHQPVHRHAAFHFKSLEVMPNQTVLLVTRNDRNSGNIPNRRIYDVQRQHRKALLLRAEGFALRLFSPDGTLVDMAGNLDGRSGRDKPRWALPSGWTESGERSSLIRRYEAGVASQGTLPGSWVRASDTSLLDPYTYFGHGDDHGTPGYRRGSPLPVTLSSLRTDLRDGAVVVKWTTASEMENAGFNILRGESKEGQFIKVNPSLILGAGTTAEGQTYTYRDTTAAVNVLYYYRLEEVSLSGERRVIATVRVRGHVSAANKRLWKWADVKPEEHGGFQK